MLLILTQTPRGVTGCWHGPLGAGGRRIKACVLQFISSSSSPEEESMWMFPHLSSGFIFSHPQFMLLPSQLCVFWGFLEAKVRHIIWGSLMGVRAQWVCPEIPQGQGRDAKGLYTGRLWENLEWWLHYSPTTNSDAPEGRVSGSGFEMWEGKHLECFDGEEIIFEYLMFTLG